MIRGLSPFLIKWWVWDNKVPPIWIFWQHHLCCDVVVTQINYPSLKHKTQDSIEQERGRSHEEDLVQIFMLYVMQFGGGFDLWWSKI